MTVGVAPSPSALPSSPSVAPSPSPTSSPSDVASPDPATCGTNLSSYRLDVRRTGAVTASDEQVVTAGLRLAQRHFDVRVPGCAPGTVRASVLNRENDRFAAGTFVTDAPNFRIDVYAGSSAWERIPRSQIPVLMLHEWYHVLQYSFLHCGAPRCAPLDRPVPAWLIEGGAEYAAAQAAQDERVIFYSFIRRYELARAAQVDTPLQRLDEIRSGADYGLSFVAVELLVDGSNPGALLEFWEDAGSRGRWEAAFPDAFGITPARFYRAFAAYRARDFQS